MKQKKQDIVRAAIQLERDGRKFYRDVAANASSDLARQMFQSLADDELLHIEWIEKNIARPKETGRNAKKRTYDRLRGIFADVPNSVRQEAASSEDDIKAMNAAIKMEEKSRSAYLKWAEESAADDLRAVCAMLADQESFHRKLLENTIQYFQSTADWFMQEEGWHFDGG
jgi:rubrerythrin